MTDAIDHATIERWASAIVAVVAPDEARPRSDTPAHPPAESLAELTSFGALLVPFLIGFFGDVAKDVVKDQAKKAVGRLLQAQLDRKANRDDASRLASEIDAAIAASALSDQQKKTLRSGFKELLRKLGPST